MVANTNRTAEDPAAWWARSGQMTQIETDFRSLKGELGKRPVCHRLEDRVDGPILVAFLAGCPQVTLKKRLQMQVAAMT